MYVSECKSPILDGIVPLSDQTHLTLKYSSRDSWPIDDGKEPDNEYKLNSSKCLSLDRPHRPDGIDPDR